jgi:hypothetical protein
MEFPGYYWRLDNGVTCMVGCRDFDWILKLNSVSGVFKMGSGNSGPYGKIIFHQDQQFSI